MATNKSIKDISKKFPIIFSVAHTQRMFREGYQLFISVEDFKTGKIWDYAVVFADPFPAHLWKGFLDGYGAMRRVAREKKQWKQVAEQKK